MSNSISTQKLTIASMTAAVICIFTMLIKIPVPATQGYIHFGDAFVLLAAVFPGGAYGIIAAGAGSALADLFSGSVMYSPVSFVIKALCCIVTLIIYHNLSSKIKKPVIRMLAGGIASTAIITGGYFLFEIFIYGAGAAVEIPMNLIQGGAATGIACALITPLLRIPLLRKYM